jgi:choline dehydrogenase-like flavoprotein
LQQPLLSYGVSVAPPVLIAHQFLSSHPHGGNAIDADPEKGAIDPHLRVHGTTNLFVTDASVFPSNMRVNAQYSTMAIAHYAMELHKPFGR